MRFPRPIRRPLDHYADRELRFHLTIHAHPKITGWSAPVADGIWEAALNERTRGRVQLFAACLMPDHLHLIVAPGEVDILRFLNTFKSWTTRTAWGSGNSHALWQPGMWDRTIRDEGDFTATLEYVVRNPVVAGLVEHPADWPWVWAYFMD
jgi:REP element-mobilizing transposase RayT